MPEEAVAIATYALCCDEADVGIRCCRDEGNAVLCACIGVGKVDDSNFLPVLVGSFGVVRAEERNLRGMVVGCSLSLEEIEFAVAHHVLHLGELDVVTTFGCCTIVAAVPEAAGIAVDEDTCGEVAAVATAEVVLAVGRSHLVSSCDEAGPDDVLCRGESCIDFLTQGVVLCHEEVVVRDDFEGFDEFLCFVLGNVFEIPFAGAVVAICHRGCCSPEAELVLGVHVCAGLSEAGVVISRTSVTELVEVVVATASPAGGTDIEEVSHVAAEVGIVNIVFNCEVEDDVACQFLIVGEEDTVLRCVAFGAEVAFHACILHEDAVAVLCEFPDVAGQVVARCSIDAVAFVRLVEGCGESLSNITCLGSCGLIEQGGDDAIVAVAVGKEDRHLAVDYELEEGVHLGLHLVDTIYCKVSGDVFFGVVDIVVNEVEQLKELFIGVPVAALTGFCFATFFTHVHDESVCIAYIVFEGDIEVEECGVDSLVSRGLFECPDVGGLVAVAGSH